MTFEKAFIIKKLEELSGYAKEAEPLLSIPVEEILKDNLKVHTLERLLQLIVDDMVDINQHFIRELKLKVSEDFQGTFYILAENRILDNDFAKKLAPIVGLRNRIVHRYEAVDLRLFVESFKKDLPDIYEYSRQIMNAIESR